MNKQGRIELQKRIHDVKYFAGRVNVSLASGESAEALQAAIDKFNQAVTKYIRFISDHAKTGS